MNAFALNTAIEAQYSFPEQHKNSSREGVVLAKLAEASPAAERQYSCKTSRAPYYALYGRNFR